MKSLVKRAIDPGSEVQWCLILEGPQGIGKSRALEAIGGRFYAEVQSSIWSVDFMREISRGAWLAHMAELSQIRGGSVESVKQIISRPEDRYVDKYEKEARRYLEVEPGDDLNLDAKEMAAFRALNSASKDGAVPIQKVEALIREGLLARYQAYHTKGLAGIAPYARKSGRHLLASDELSIATKQSKLVAKYLPSVYDVLIKYPATTTLKQGKEFEEQFFWINSEVFGRPTFALSHRLLFQVGEAYVFVDRQYYASHEYNCLQQGAAALPTKDGTVVVYVSRVSTEQVAGFGSSMKHSASRVLMTPYFKDLLEALRAKAEKQ
jgi:hypothetical protein